MQTFKLNNGVEIPVLGFGVFQIPAEQTAQAVVDAVKAGYRHIWCRVSCMVAMPRTLCRMPVRIKAMERYFCMMASLCRR